MARRIRRIALLIVAALVVALVVLVIAVRPRIQDTSKDANTAWKPLLAPLSARYRALQNVETAMVAVGLKDSSVTKELNTALSDWALLAPTNNAVDQAETANHLEGLARRARVITTSTDRLKANAPLVASFGAYDKTDPPIKQVTTFNAAVVDYEHARDGVLRSIVADINGYDARPTLQISAP